MSVLVKRSAAAAAILLLSTGVALADGKYGLGRAATAEEIAGWDTDVRPDGTGLPEGAGSVLDGEEIYLEQCAVCHGEFGEAVGRYPVLMGGSDTLNENDPVKTVGSYWPYASTLWDYIQRAMPFGDARSLTDDQTYAVTAYVLYLNDVIEDEEFVLSRANFGEIRMPNEEGFFLRAEPEFAAQEPCMSNCKDSVEIIGRARIIDVTPEDQQQLIE